jgi:hypothetical protein
MKKTQPCVRIQFSLEPSAPTALDRPLKQVLVQLILQQTLIINLYPQMLGM